MSHVVCWVFDEDVPWPGLARGPGAPVRERVATRIVVDVEDPAVVGPRSGEVCVGVEKRIPGAGRCREVRELQYGEAAHSIRAPCGRGGT